VEAGRMVRKQLVVVKTRDYDGLELRVCTGDRDSWANFYVLGLIGFPMN